MAQRSKAVNFKASMAEYSVIMTAARRNHRSLADYSRMIVLAQARKELGLPDPDQAERELPVRDSANND